MNTELWNLFWTTGMPEAWLMSRDGVHPAPGGTEPGDGRDPSGPLTCGPSLSGNVPGGPERLY